MTALTNVLNSLNIGATIEIISKQCSNSYAKPMNEVGIFKSIDKEQGIHQNLTRIVVEQRHQYTNTVGKKEIRPVKMYFYTQNIEDIKIISK